MRPFKGAIDIFTSSLLNVLWTFRGEELKEVRFGCSGGESRTKPK